MFQLHNLALGWGLKRRGASCSSGGSGGNFSGLSSSSWGSGRCSTAFLRFVCSFLILLSFSIFYFQVLVYVSSLGTASKPPPGTFWRIMTSWRSRILRSGWRQRSPPWRPPRRQSNYCFKLLLSFRRTCSRILPQMSSRLHYLNLVNLLVRLPGRPTLAAYSQFRQWILCQLCGEWPCLRPSSLNPPPSLEGGLGARSWCEALLSNFPRGLKL